MQLLPVHWLAIYVRSFPVYRLQSNPRHFMFSNIYLKNHEAKFLEEIKKKKKRGSGQEKESGRERETYVFFYLALLYAAKSRA